MQQSDIRKNFSRVNLIWSFAKKYKLSFISLYICLAAETVIKMIMPVILGLLIDEVTFYMDMNFFWRITLIYSICMVCICFLHSTQPRVWQYLMTRFLFDIRLKLFANIITARASYLSNAKTGDLITRINSDTSEFMNIIQRNTFRFFNGIVQLALAITFVSIYSWKIAMLMAITIPVSVLISRYYGKRAKEQSAKSRKAYGDYVSWVYEIIKGLREVKLMAAEKRASISFVKHYKEMVIIKIKFSFTKFRSKQLVEFVNLLSSICLYILSAVLSLRGEITLGAFIAILDYFTRSNDMLAFLVNNNIDLQFRKAAVDRIYELLSIDTEKDDCTKEKLKITEGVIEFLHVSFSYKNRKTVLKDINFKIKSGEHVAIVGASGAGKTTLAYLLLKFYMPNDGTILIDGTDISKCSLESLRKCIGLVQQETLMFNGTIRMNLALGNLHSTDDEMLDACDKASIGDFVRELPEGLDTIIGKDGIELSGGQRQRLAITRIYLKNPKILILDEATSALDYEAEKAVHKAWDELSKGRTTITIAHRLTTVIKSDKVAVLDDGRIVSYDYHLKLLEICPCYQKLFKEQYVGQEIEMVC